MALIPKLEFVDNAKHFYKMASMQLLAVFASIIGFIIANPTWLYSPIMFMPDEQRIPLAIGTTILIVVLVGGARLLKKKRKEQPDGQPAPEPECERPFDPYP